MAALSLLLLLLGLLPAAAWPADDTALLRATGSPQAAQALPAEALEPPSADDPLWPIAVYLRGEALRLRGESRAAARAFARLVDWAAGDPEHDERGGSALALVAAWRWLQLAEAGGEDPALLGEHPLQRFQAVLALRRRPLTRRLLDEPILGRLPQMEGDVLLRMSRLAHALGEDAAARKLFVEHLAVTTDPALDEFGKAMMQSLQASGFPLERVELLRAERLQELRRLDEARTLFETLRGSDTLAVRAEAGYHLAAIRWTRREWVEQGSRAGIQALLDSVIEESADPELAQQAMYRSALYAQRAGVGRDPARFQRYMRRLVAEFPEGSLVDDALFRLASAAEDAGRVDEALGWYERLQALQPPHDWESSAYFRPALMLYTRNGPGDVERARTLLERLEQRYPSGDLHRPALFWLGRLDQQLGHAAEARTRFRRLVEEAPFDYYALRARMRLAIGPAAARRLRADPQTRRELAEAFGGAAPASGPLSQSAYGRRVEAAIDSGLYAAALEAEPALRRRFPDQQLAAVALDRLDQGRLPALAVLLALRADAAAAFEAEREDRGTRLRVVAALGQRAGDLAMSADLVINGSEIEGTDDRRVRESLQRAPGYLAVAYPPVYVQPIRAAARAFDAPPALVYSIVRRESLFRPAALSAAGALGLFQFMPDTFATLDRRYRLLEGSGLDSREAYLMDPDQAIRLGALWLGRELLGRRHGDLLLSVMEHNAGWPAVRSWLEKWKAQGREGDVEFMIETIGYGETRIFTRRVLTDTELVEAGGILEEASR